MGTKLCAGHLICPVWSPNVSFPAIHSLIIFIPWVSKECGDPRITSGSRLEESLHLEEEGQPTLEKSNSVLLCRDGPSAVGDFKNALPQLPLLTLGKGHLTFLFSPQNLSSYFPFLSLARADIPQADMEPPSTGV